MPILVRAEYPIGDLLVRYVAPEDRPDAWGLQLLPLARARDAVAPREWLDSPAITQLPAQWNRSRAWEVDPLVHAHVSGDVLPGGFAHGRTLRHSATTASLAVREHSRAEVDGDVVLTTVLAAACGLVCRHALSVDPRTGVATVRVTAENPTNRPLTLDYLSAFSLGGLTPFAADDASGRLHMHRFRSAWSAEGRHEERTLEALHLERSWTGHGVRSERFGQAGSLPVNGWFPFVGLEDRAAGVTWAAQVATPGTWNLEIFRRADQVALSGGGPDRLAGEWRHPLAPGASVTAPEAFLTVAVGGVDEACDRLLNAARGRAEPLPTGEAELPVVFNEWCTSWGHPTHDSLVALADRLAGTGVRYLVIDDGWAERPGDQFQQNGDWRVNRRAFPGGLRATTAAIRARGLVPGLWFEFEAINLGSAAWHETSHQLHRDGVPLEVGPRRFWDFRDPWVHDFLAERVLARLRDDGFGYLKVDCNDSIGPGVDGPLSPGENLREHLAGVQRFFARLRRELPDLVIENCSSGGHRLEPSMMALTAMSSFSDAHETSDIPLIAANLNPLVWSAQKQIWAVLRAGDSPARLNYSLAATFLGRMCLSGDVGALDEARWARLAEAIAFYREVAPLIRDGVARCRRSTGESLARPTGNQVVTFTSSDGRRVLAVWHAFADAPAVLQLALPGARSWRVANAWGDAAPTMADAKTVSWHPSAEWVGGVILLHADVD
ncbi:MAG: alpha-galactosidase [Candidatus Didemnitutus sp.]|nr:alpha-galactosidase [Candidatus Didemnitutus sp.]